jgi:hypothetical protein
MAQEALQKYVQWGGDDADLPAGKQPTAPASETEDGEPSGTIKEPSIYVRLSQVWDEMGLTPAEAMLLLDPENSDGLTMMQYTLIDLLARDILASDGGLRVGRGEQYGRINLAAHEALFAKYFSRISDYVDIDKLARAALAELDDDGEAFKAAYVRASLLRKGYMEVETRRIAGLLPIQHAVTSTKGAMARNRLQRLLGEADRQLARSLANDPDQANAYVDKGGPALVLMDTYPSHHFKRWHDLLLRIGFGPAIKRVRTRASRTTFGGYVEEFLKELLGS